MWQTERRNGADPQRGEIPRNGIGEEGKRGRVSEKTNSMGKQDEGVSERGKLY